MLTVDPESRPETLVAAAGLICLTAGTADLLMTALPTGDVKSRVAEQMCRMAEREGGRHLPGMRRM